MCVFDFQEPSEGRAGTWQREKGIFQNPWQPHLKRPIHPFAAEPGYRLSTQFSKTGTGGLSPVCIYLSLWWTQATPCHRVNRPACSVQRHVVIAGGWKAQIHFNDCAALNSQRLRILNLMAITDLLLKALSNRFIGLKELLLWDLSHLIYLSHLRYLEIF